MGEKHYLPNIQSHLGVYGGTEHTIVKKAIIDSKDLTNVYFDISGITSPFVTEYAVKHFNTNKIIFGGDFPFTSFLANHFKVNDAEISESLKNKIFYENFERLFY